MNTQLEVVYKRLYPQARRVTATSTLSRDPDVYLARDAVAAGKLAKELRGQFYDAKVEEIR